MGKVLFEKIKESLVSVMPVALIVLVLAFTPLLELSLTEIVTFAVCAVLLVIGMVSVGYGSDLRKVEGTHHVNVNPNFS